MANVSVKFPVCNGQDLEACLEQVTEQTFLDAGGAVIADRAKAYAINIELDRIQDVLKEDRSVWERFQGIFWYRKYHSCRAVYERLHDSLKEEYRERMRREFKRAMQTGQLEHTLFTAADWKHVRSMINRSEGAASMLRAIPVTRILAPYIPEPVRRTALNFINRVMNLKSKVMK